VTAAAEEDAGLQADESGTDEEEEEDEELPAGDSSYHEEEESYAESCEEERYVGDRD
jgi:hypothetical protein